MVFTAPTLEDLMNRSTPKFLIVGECGDGKSTLINALAGGEVAVAAMNPEGVTKKLGYYFSDVVKGIIIDTPGVGDMDINVTALLGMVTEALQRFDVHAVIICSKEYTRIKMGGQLVSRLVDVGFKSMSKWENVIFTWTHGDTATPALISNLSTVVSTTMSRLKIATTPRSCVTKCPPGGPADLSQLVTHLNAVSQSEGIGEFAAPTTEAIAQVISNVTGVDFEQTVQELKAVQDQMREQQEQHKKDLEALEAKFTAAAEKARSDHESKMVQLNAENKAEIARIQASGAANIAELMAKQSELHQKYAADAAEERRRMDQRLADLQKHSGGGGGGGTHFVPCSIQ